MTVAVVAEKPSVARDIARALGATTRGNGFFHGAGYAVTWAIGHLVRLAEPHEIDLRWKRWRREDLPILPREFPLVVAERTADQFEIVKKVLHARTVTEIVCATDAGREGELIFRYLYDAAECTRPVRRLWISSLTDEAIRDGFSRLRASADLDALADAARGRSRADWLVGMNLSRAYSLTFDDDFSVGRVQTPTLAMVVERELAIREFVPEPYCEVVAKFAAPLGEPAATYTGTWFLPEEGKRGEPSAIAKRLPADGVLAGEIVARGRTGTATVESVVAETKRLPPPFLYDLTELQRHANRLFGLSAKRTLDVAQALYERHKLLSYPRTDSRHLSTAIAGTLPGIVSAIAPRYPGLVAEGSGARPLGKRFVDDARITDHHAIVPTGADAARCSLDEDERRLYDLVCRRLLAAWHGDYVWGATSVVTAVASPAAIDRFFSSGTSVVSRGWKVLDLGKEDESITLPALAKGAPRVVAQLVKLDKKTTPPRRYTEATLLTAMETAGRGLEEKELSDAMRDRGLGTPATRASILETLLARAYMERDGKALVATEKGIRLVGVVHPHVKSPAMTGEWEAKLRAIERRASALPAFMLEIEAYVREVVAAVAEGPPPGPASHRSPPPSSRPLTRPANEPGGLSALSPRASGPSPSPGPSPRTSTHPSTSTSTNTRTSAPRPSPGTLADLLRERFGFAAFRPHQEEVCRASIAGEDALLVMPTGAGKSLCYQLPGVARGGTTLVVSPLVALMDDQVAKLKRQGFSADRIHRGRDRAETRRVCADYLAGTLDFLYVAPERLAVPGFSEMLARRKPSLVAIDEAHCISQWGHDFRPEYRMLGERLPSLRPAPIIALTATATPTVQDDIVAQLGMPGAARFIHGFRRKNLAIECVEVAPSARADVALELLSERGRRPAIVYAPTRKECVALAKHLRKLGAAAYHAGLPADERERIQSAFLGGELDVVVATIAFGMGIDKADVRTVVHTALPSSVEAFYQEIGRAGRDGAPSNAVLLHGWSDRKTHEFFLERDYPSLEVMGRLYAALPSSPRPSSELAAAVPELGKDDALERALAKLWIHGGAAIDEAELVVRGHDRWREPYAAMRRHREDQLAAMARLAEGQGCRMIALVRHFGDVEDGLAPCGLCDCCAPANAIASKASAPSERELASLEAILRSLARSGATAKGALYKAAFPGEAIDRRTFEHLVAALARAGRVRVEDAEFVRDGETVRYQRVHRAGDEATSSGELGAVAIARARPRKRPKKARGRRGAPTLTERVIPRQSRRGRVATDGEPPLVGELRAWRRAESAKLRVPAFRVLGDRALVAIAEARPASERELLAVPGIGPSIAARYGARILAVVRGR